MNCPNCQRDIAPQSNFCYFCGARQQAPAAPATPAPQKRLMLSATDIKIAGLCAGFGEYLDVDPTIVRLVAVFLTFFTGIFPGVIAYLVAWFIIPKHVGAPAGAAVSAAAQPPIGAEPSAHSS